MRHVLSPLCRNRTQHGGTKESNIIHKKGEKNGRTGGVCVSFLTMRRDHGGVCIASCFFTVSTIAETQLHRVIGEQNTDENRPNKRATHDARRDDNPIKVLGLPTKAQVSIKYQSLLGKELVFVIIPAACITRYS